MTATVVITVVKSLFFALNVVSSCVVLSFPPYCRARTTANAFSLSSFGTPPSHWSPTATRQRKQQQQYSNPTLSCPTIQNIIRRPRGGASGNIMKSKAKKDDDKIDIEDEESTKLQDDLKSMQFCYRAAFFSTAVDVFDGTVRQRTSPLRTIFTSWTSGLDVIASLHVLGLGMGIYRIAALYAKASGSGGSSTDKTTTTTTTTKRGEYTYDDLLALVRTLRTVWFTAWIILTLGTMALSTALTGNHYAGPATIGAMAIAVASTFAGIAKTTTNDDDKGDGSDKSVVLNQARIVGIQAAMNMQCCMIGFVLDAITRCAVTLLSNPTASLFNKALGMLDVLEPAIIFLLLRALYDAFVPALMRATDIRTADDREGYAALYEAETGLYTKIGKVLFYPALTKLMSPYLIAVYGLVKTRYWTNN